MAKSYSDRYWGSGGKYQKEYEALYAALVPLMNCADTKHGELLRLISKAYYRYYNDGDGTYYAILKTVPDLEDFRLPPDLPPSVEKFVKSVQAARRPPDCCCDCTCRPDDDFDWLELERLVDDTIVYVDAKVKAGAPSK